MFVFDVFCLCIDGVVAVAIAVATTVGCVLLHLVPLSLLFANKRERGVREERASWEAIVSVDMRMLYVIVVATYLGVASTKSFRRLCQQSLELVHCRRQGGQPQRREIGYVRFFQLVNTEQREKTRTKKG